MFNKKLMVGLIVVCAVMSGCAYKPPTYDESHSHAYNVAKAGGLYQVKDRRVRQKDLDALKFASKTTSNTLLLASNAGAGLKIGPSMGLGLLTAAFEEPDTASRNSIVAWMPKSEAATTKAAQAAMASIFKVAIEETLKELGLSYKLLLDTPERVDFYFHDTRLGCPVLKNGMKRKDICYIATKIFEPYEIAAPDFVKTETPSYAFHSNHNIDYHRLLITPGRNSKLPADLLYAKISSKLPEWAFLYIAASNSQFNGTLKAPYLLEKGQINLFIRNKS